MAYLSLYRKYRPQTFDEILGQDHVANTLTNAITDDRVAHAYLFTGPRGTGKTSTARILAKALNCEKGPTPSPCGVCNSCKAITDGSSLDVIEMDAASHSKVDETREILAGVPLATAGGRRKVYVIDEVHMLSSGSFNALLKTLEEPPSHVLFILATTEAHKVLATIVSRTQRFDFRRVPTDILEKHLSHIATEEGIEIDADAIGVIARHADGGVRDALSSLDQLSNISGAISEIDAEALLGLREEDSYFELLDSIAAGEVGRVFQTLHGLVGQGADPRQLALGVLGHTRTLLLLATSPDSEGLLDVAADDVARLSGQARSLSVDHLLRILDLVGKAITEMRTAPNHRLLLEVALVRAAAPDTDPSALGLQGRIERLERRIGIDGPAPPPQQATPQPAAPAQAPPARTTSIPTSAPAPTAASPRSRPAAKAEPAPAPVSARSEPKSAPQVERTAPSQPAASAPVAAEAPQTQPVAAAGSAVPDGVGLGHVRDAWNATLAEVGRASKRIQALLNPSRPARFDDGHLVVEVQSTFHEATMSEDRNRDVLANALHSALGIRPSLGFIARGTGPAPASESPAETTGASPAASDEEEVDIESTKPLGDSESDPVELVRKGLAAEIVEERTTK